MHRDVSDRENELLESHSEAAESETKGKVSNALEFSKEKTDSRGATMGEEDTESLALG